MSNFQTMWDAKAVDDMPVPQVFSPPRITEALETLVLAGENSKKTEDTFGSCDSGTNK